MNELTNIVDLLKQLRDDTTTLVREEVALAKTEAGEKVATYARNTGFLAGGALVGWSAVQFLLLGLAFVIRRQLIARDFDEGTATFLGLFVVAVVVGIIAAILLSKALATLKKASLTPTKTIGTLKEDKQWVQNRIS
jgi:hypothetical protein